VITTPSVVASGVAYSIEAPGQVPVPSDLVDYNADLQIAVFRSPGLHAPPAPFEPGATLVPGQLLLVMGNAYGVSGAVTWGLAAGEREDGTWQVGVGISPGASGSPVMNTSGQVVGLITAALSDPSAAPFTPMGGHTAVMVPAFAILHLARQIVADGHTGRAFLGVRPETMDPSLARALGLAHGVMVGAVSFGSPAYSAGLQAGDVIIELADRPILHEESLRLALAEHCPGEVVALTVVRQKRTNRMSVIRGPQCRPCKALLPGPPPSRPPRPSNAPTSKPKSVNSKSGSKNSNRRCVDPRIRDDPRSGHSPDRQATPLLPRQNSAMPGHGGRGTIPVYSASRP
jgi:S1-C subfamily serine protease